MFSLDATFGQRLKEERLRLDLTQGELAEKMGVRPLTIIQYEKGKSSPSVNFVYTLQNIGFDIVYLMTATANPHLAEFSPALIREVADLVDQIEHEIIGKPLNNEAKIKLILLMLSQYVKTGNEQTVVPFTFQSILNKCLKNNYSNKCLKNNYSNIYSGKTKNE